MTTSAPFHFDSALACRLEQAEAATTTRYIAARAALDPGADSTAAAIADGAAFFAGPGSPVNRVVGLGMAQAVERADIARCEAFYAARGEVCRIDLCPLAHPSLRALLQERGYTVGLFKHVSVLPLIGRRAEATVPPAIVVQPVAVQQAGLWADTLAAAADGGAPNPAARAIAQPNVYKSDTICFVAWVGGEAAGGGALAIVDGVGICYSTAVRPAQRRQGVQRALLDARLTYAQARGCDLAMVQTAPGSASQRNVERCGFRLAYTKATMVCPIPG